MFPADEHRVRIDNQFVNQEHVDLELSDINIAPCGIDKRIGSKFEIRISMKQNHLSVQAEKDGISYVSLASNFAETVWSCKLDTQNRPKPTLEASETQPLFLSGTYMKFRSVSFPRGWESTILVDQSAPCTMIHNLPFRKFNRSASSGGGKPAGGKGIGVRLIDDEFFKGMNDRRNKPLTIDDLVRLDERKDIQYENRARLDQLAKTTYPPARSSGPSTTPQQLERLTQISLTPADTTKASQANHVERTSVGTRVNVGSVNQKASSTISEKEPTTTGLTFGTTQNTGGLLR